MFPEINYDKAESIWAWTSSFAPRPRPTTKRARCCARSTSRSGSEGLQASDADTWRLDGKEEFSREQQAPQRSSSKKFAAGGSVCTTIANDDNSMEERFEARLRLAALPRNGAPIRIRNRCEVTGPAARLLPQAEDVAYRVA